MRYLRITTRSLVCLLTIGIVAASAVAIRAYSTFGKWQTSSVIMYVNPQNADVTTSAAETALQFGMNVWNTQGNANVKFVYGGRVSDTTTAYDSRNVVIFRNASDGSAIATTYSWSSGGYITDADVVFWDQSFQFFTGTSGCSNGAYIEDIAAHELGHALGLLHSSVSTATMVSGYPYCSQEPRTLDPDDVSGVQSLYGASSTKTANTSPVVTISTPGNGLSVPDGTSISFAGSASDAEDGNISSRLTWTSSIDGTIGSGSAFTRTLSAGSHVITATVTDAAGARGSASVSVTVTTTATTTPTLSATGTRKGRQLKANLRWSGFTASMLDIYRNGVLVFATANDGSQTDSIKAGGTYVYQACASGTSTCSNQASVTF